MAAQQHPGTAQESIWEYPRPPRVEDCFKHVQVVFNGMAIADSQQSVRVLEKGHPPVFYFPPEDVFVKTLAETAHRTTCEFKGEAHYYTISVGGRQAENAAWCYPEPAPPYTRIKRYLAFYPRLMDACLVDDEAATPEDGDFYGGWITRDITGMTEKGSQKGA